MKDTKIKRNDDQTSCTHLIYAADEVSAILEYDNYPQ